MEVVFDGCLVKYIYNELLDLSDISPETNIARASHVEPTAAGQWTADMAPSGGPVLGPFQKRSEALAAEVEWLREKMCG